MKPTRYINAVDYLEGIVENKSRKRRINNAVRTIRKFIAKLPQGEKPQAIACCGLSGLLLGTAIADRLGLDLIVVRKKDDKSTHSSIVVEGVAAGSYIIVDDLIFTGKTMKYIIESIDIHLCEYSLCVGAYLHHVNKQHPKALPMLSGEKVRREYGYRG